MTQDELFKVLVAHCKEYGFIFPSSEIYDGLAAVYDSLFHHSVHISVFSLNCHQISKDSF